MASTGSRTDTAELAVAQDIFQAAGNISALPASLYIALTTTVPTDSTAGTAASYTGYARIAVARNSTQWAVDNSLGRITTKNINNIVFGTCTANAQTIWGVEIWTASSGGQRLYWTALSVGVSIPVGSAPIILANGLLIDHD